MSLLAFIPKVVRHMRVAGCGLGSRRMGRCVGGGPIDLPSSFLGMLQSFPSLGAPRTVCIPLCVHLAKDPVFGATFDGTLKASGKVCFRLSAMTGMLGKVGSFAPIARRRLTGVSTLSAPICLRAIGRGGSRLLTGVRGGGGGAKFAVGRTNRMDGRSLFTSVVSGCRKRALLISF